MTTGVGAPGRAQIEARTLRTDRWWASPAFTFAFLLVMVVYLTWAIFANKDYFWEPYISPMYSPCLTGNCVPGSGWGWFGSIAPVTPAIIIIIFPMGFRVTCYYYRKAYYRAVWASPAACAVPEPHRKYTGERRFPLVMQNIHRYFWYIAFVFAIILTADLVMSFRDHQGNWGHMGLGTLVLLVNVGLIWAYTLSCHSCRHITGGRLKHFSKHPLRYKAWTFVSKLNAKHMQLAWASLAWIGVTDLYIRLVAANIITDLRFF
ncbi:MAG TPA: hypothetical protein VHX38_32400 [Pseudonocardiaceae bacterium]|jgi:hypothetical protein|nr:hypothetical protein [Pseudonocardiaceae bacterium]